MKKFNYLFLFIMMICLCSCSNSNLKYDVRYHWEIDESGAIVNKEKHTFSDWYVIEESTCIVAGTQQRKCTVCSYKEIEELELKKHEEVVTKQGTPPTFYEDGITDEIKCLNCNNILQEQSVSPKLTSSQELVYELNESGDGYIVVGAYESLSTELFVGLEHEGLPIVALANNAFRNHYWIKTIKIADNVKKIGSSAFEYCSSLEVVVLPNGITTIEDKLFNECKNLKEVILPEGITKIGNSAFGHCKELEKLNIPSTVTELGEYAFGSTIKLEKLTLPDGISLIPKSCFDCSGIKQINIPSNVKKIERGAFIACVNLERIEIPANCEILENFVFNSCRKLKEVILSEGLQTIGQLCFSGCNALSEIVIPSTVTKIGPSAFKNNADLVVNCKVEFKPDGWDNEWIDSNSTVNWNYKE